MKKLIFTIIDGMAGRPVKEFNGSTPLESAETPFMDYLSKNGMNGLITIINDKIPPETEGGMLALFGYDPLKYSRGRGPTEAYGMDIDFQEGDLAFRSNFVTLEKNKIVDARAGRIITKDARQLTTFVKRNIELEILPVDVRLATTLNYRLIVIFHSKQGKLSNNISNTHPGYEKIHHHFEIPRSLIGEKVLQECKPLDDTEEARITADLVNEFTKKSHNLLENHPLNIERKKKGLAVANGIVMRGSGTSLPKLENFRGRNKRWLCIADTPAEKGIAKLLGMELLEGLPEPECDHELNTKNEIERAVKIDMTVRLKKLFENFNDYDYFYIHIKGTDPFGHRGMFKEKKKMIEDIDKYFFKSLIEGIKLDDVVICVTSDHCTACDVRSHTPDPVSVLVSGGNVERDGVERFGESFCKKGKIGNIHATELMNILMDAMGDN